MTPEVVCIGGSTVDIVINEIDPIRTFQNLVNYVDDITVCLGGDALNEALSIAKLGHRTALMTCVGRDSFGRIIKEELEQKGIDVSDVYEKEDCSTTAAICLAGPNDRRNFLFKKQSAVNALNRELLNCDKIFSAKVMTFGSLVFCDGFSEGDLIRLFSGAKDHGVTTVADVALTEGSAGDLEKIRGALQYLDFFFPNYEEASQLTGEKDPEKIAEIFRRYGVKHVILKLGADGCLAVGPEERLRVFPYKVPVVNTTGAGDNFLAGYISTFLEKKSMRECLTCASAAAALTIQSSGASTGVRDKQQILDFIRENRTLKIE